MKISVVIPLYNKELYIQRAIKSVLHQNTPADELIVVDDGSTDSSAKEVQKLSDPHIRLIQQPNTGECAARNRGIADAKYDLVAFLDADDEWKPDFLTHIKKLYMNFPDCGAYATAYEEKRSSGDTRFPPLSTFPPYPWIGIVPNLFISLQESSPFCSSSIVIPKKVCLELDGFPVGIDRGGDLIMWIHLGVNYPIAYSSSRQAIYHTEALNRACNVFPSERETAPAKVIETMLDKREIPFDLLEDVKDYYTFLQISKAREMIKRGKRKASRILLTKVKKNAKHHLEWLKWYYLSFVPFALLQLMIRLHSGSSPKKFK